jgi:hypothetical protein
MFYFPYFGILRLFCIKIHFKWKGKNLLPLKTIKIYHMANNGKLNTI